jgi:AraC-like DNA-binding protein
MPHESFLSPVHEADEPRFVGPHGMWAAAGYTRPIDALYAHAHRAIEVGIVIEGEEDHYYGSCLQRCGPGDIWLCAMWEPHGWRVTHPDTWTVIVRPPLEMLGHELVAGVPWLWLFYPRPEDRPQIRSEERRARVLATAGLMTDEIQRQPPGWENSVRLLLLLALTELVRDWKQPPPTLSGADPDDLAAIMPAMALVHTTPWQRVEVTRAAEACGMCVSTFRARFVRTMGLNFSDFCRRARLSAAAHSLLTTDRTVAAIAREAGFIDDSHFRRHFRKHYQLGPAEYRRAHAPLPASAASHASGGHRGGSIR